MYIFDAIVEKKLYFLCPSCPFPPLTTMKWAWAWMGMDGVAPPQCDKNLNPSRKQKILEWNFHRKFNKLFNHYKSYLVSNYFRYALPGYDNSKINHKESKICTSHTNELALCSPTALPIL